ncbi:hypothetical protein Catovirus_1_509 [Catovirus CTV1]|uniref:Uncharacterized protein n=1 Tax=Catovirus CTV1 TaxID=1977631 RepID=A0A1V0S9T6_9VIRU|nr:hypothetical protein Catovirus_1_509 [Catovirus CTV1]
MIFIQMCQICVDIIREKLLKNQFVNYSLISQLSEYFKDYIDNSNPMDFRNNKMLLNDINHNNKLFSGTL